MTPDRVAAALIPSSAPVYDNPPTFTTETRR